MSITKDGVGKLIHIRSLNYLKREHPLTYVGGRILSESLHPEIFDDWTTNYLSRRAKTGRQPVYWQHSLFKGLKINGDPEFRTCLVGSPTTHLLEVWVLWKLSQNPEFTASSSVYSNLWPHTSSHHVFRHFMDGYRNREKAIAESASTLRDPFVVVLDLKRFYPSIDISLAYSRFKDKVENAGFQTDEHDSILQCVSAICRRRKTPGLPIGPPLAHVIASVYLEGVDRKLDREFPGRYFRYVDDVALVVEKSDVGRAKRLFKCVVQDEGLNVNEEKTDEHPAKIWQNHVNARSESQRFGNFGDLISRLSQYLAHNPDDFDSLKEQFQNEGFLLPFSKVKSVAAYRPFRRLVKRFYDYLGWESVVGDIRPNGILNDARHLREQFIGQARKSAGTILPINGIQRRWAVQHLRYTFHRLLYLLPKDQVGEFEGYLPNADELASTKALYRAISTGNASNLIHYPGPAISAFAQIWSENYAAKPEMLWSEFPRAHERDAVITLALYNLCEPPPGWIEKFASKKDYNATALRIANAPYSESRSHDDFSYIDEMESLFLTPNISPVNLLNTRFDKHEDIVLPALSLNSGSEIDAEADY